MSELRTDLRAEFHDLEVRHVYADESLNTYIATQLKVLREQREWTQAQLAKAAEMAQPRIAVMEDVNYSSWSLSTLKRLARAFDLRLSVRFEAFSSLISEIEGFSRESLQRASFEDDAWFFKKDAQSENSPVLVAAKAAGEVLQERRAKVLSFTGSDEKQTAQALPYHIGPAAAAATAIGGQ